MNGRHSLRSIGNWLRATTVSVAAVALTGCIASTGPLLTGAAPVLGERLHLQLYSLDKGYAGDPEQAQFAWNGSAYAHAGGSMRDVASFTVHPVEGDVAIIQSFPAKAGRDVEYAVMRTLTDGVYLVKVIDEADADPATRAACDTSGGAACRVASRAQLIAFARATAAKPTDSGGLAIRLQVPGR